ncbi:MAG: protoheme IX biogenesis protein HemY [Hafnia paralvei]|jgi:HemY protein|uniref:protoheme IX biogenesis protein HemY n=1 Tax=Hafnia paralvei TaxID=546367 RepID=UPI001034CCBB|nr:protoheme IX biogenesis protein HemY [Hafnia paralvei]MCE9881705.1 protoheme IX biogenesis protein HemY [Hafnia paralvei]MCE9906828.1 protoheme IX biogenesis protein HemY [Hafnia paralvei]MCE9913690.1 protoheme IX biogenesis protein HemY [Hafnia paralvei]NUN43522.1 protoheme IX biogenesis protein HemY [Hafnia paralvei]TBL97421.1 protoheme IX biogenesis protein HemY [Hafnia paralvei]
MLKVLLLFIILIAGVVLGPMFAGHQGYVLIQTDTYNIETSVTALVIMLILLIVVLFAIEWILRRVFRTGARTRGWFVGRKRTRARKQTREGLMKLAEGDYTQVEKLLSRNADHAEQPVVNYLLAAEAAQQRGDELRVNQYLERASEVADSNQLPVDITRVRIQLARGENHAARHGVDALLNVAPRHPEVLRLAEQAYVRTQAYQSLLEILPSLAKANVYNDDEIQQLQLKAYIGLMNERMANGGSLGLKSWWNDQSRKTRHETALQVAMIEHLIECNDHDTAQQILVDGLKRKFDERLVLLMPKLKSGNPEQLEKLLNQQIKQHGASALLNSTLGQLLMRHGEWQQASEAFRAALKQRPDAYDYAWLADVLDKLHRPEEAAQMRRDGLLLTLKQDQPANPA